MHKISPNLKTPALQHLDKMAFNLHEKYGWTVFIRYEARNYCHHNRQRQDFSISIQDAGHHEGCVVKYCYWAEFKDLYFNLLNKGISAWPDNQKNQK